MPYHADPLLILRTSLTDFCKTDIYRSITTLFLNQCKSMQPILDIVQWHISLVINTHKYLLPVNIILFSKSAPSWLTGLTYPL